MPTLEVTAYNDEDIWEVLEAEKKEHPEYLYPNAPEFQTGSNQVTAIQPCKVNPDYVEPEVIEEVEVVEEVVVEAATCKIRLLKGIGPTCGRDLPCQYHES